MPFGRPLGRISFDPYGALARVPTMFQASDRPIPTPSPPVPAPTPIATAAMSALIVDVSLASRSTTVWLETIERSMPAFVLV